MVLLAIFGPIPPPVRLSTQMPASPDAQRRRAAARRAAAPVRRDRRPPARRPHPRRQRRPPVAASSASARRSIAASSAPSSAASPATSAAGPTTCSCASSTSLLGLPLLFVILVVRKFLGGGNWIGVTDHLRRCFGWPGIARLVRSLFLSLREEDFVDAARAVGVGDRPDHLPPHPAQRAVSRSSSRRRWRRQRHHRRGVRQLPRLRGRPDHADAGATSSPARSTFIQPGQLVVGVLPGHGHRPDRPRHQLHGRRPARRARPAATRMTDLRLDDAAVARERRAAAGRTSCSTFATCGPTSTSWTAPSRRSTASTSRSSAAAGLASSASPAAARASPRSRSCG